jgi:hypothetical protein
MNWLDFVLIALAAWRVASMFVNEDGPLDIFRHIRDRLIPEGEITGFLPNLLSCVWCCSVWTAAAMYLVWEVWPLPVIILAASTVAIAIDRVLTK